VAAPARCDDRIVVGVDTHRDVHAAVALSGSGVVVASVVVATTSRGIRELRRWARSLGVVEAWGVEGTGCYGAGLARALLAAGERVVEVNRPDRRARRVLGGKTDLIDAEAAARSVVANYATATPKTGGGVIEMTRIVRAARSSAVKSRTIAMNQLKALIVTAPPALRDTLSPLPRARLIAQCSAFRPGAADTPDAATRRTLRHLARRWSLLNDEVREHTVELTRLVELAAPALLGEHGVGPDTAAALLLAVGDNPQRLASEAAFAALCGVSPIEMSSGKSQRRRLNRGGDRQANSALYTIVISRLRWDQRTRAYVDRRVTDGKTRREAIRCLKRYVAREIYQLITRPTLTPATT